ncbi:hypothetical protein UT300005_17400 [Clostridium sp. CTA-5]
MFLFIYVEISFLNRQVSYFNSIHELYPIASICNFITATRSWITISNSQLKASFTETKNFVYTTISTFT